MRCIECQSPVEVQAFSESISQEMSKIDNAKLMPRLELMILHELHKAGTKILARDIAEELDVSSQLIAKRAEKLERNRYVARDRSANPIKYSISDKAIEDYFHDA